MKRASLATRTWIVTRLYIRAGKSAIAQEPGTIVPKKRTIYSATGSERFGGECRAEVRQALAGVDLGVASEIDRAWCPVVQLAEFAKHAPKGKR